MQQSWEACDGLDKFPPACSMEDISWLTVYGSLSVSIVDRIGVLLKIAS